MVVDEKGTFRDDNFQKAIAQLNDVDGAGGRVRRTSAGYGWYGVVWYPIEQTARSQ
jgi:hypothetical protein